MRAVKGDLRWLCETPEPLFKTLAVLRMEQTQYSRLCSLSIADTRAAAPLKAALLRSGMCNVEPIGRSNVYGMQMVLIPRL